jgi:hypothetical protein
VTTRAERVVEGLQGFLLQVEVSEIVAHEADEPNALVDFLDAEPLTGLSELAGFVEKSTAFEAAYLAGNVDQAQAVLES